MICVGCVGNCSGEVAFCVCVCTRFGVVCPVVYVVVVVYVSEFLIDIIIVVCRLVRVCNVVPVVVFTIRILVVVVVDGS